MKEPNDHLGLIPRRLLEIKMRPLSDRGKLVLEAYLLRVEEGFENPEARSETLEVLWEEMPLEDMEPVLEILEWFADTTEKTANLLEEE